MKLTLHKILSELKVIDKRIEKGITEMTPICVKRGAKLVNNPSTESDFISSAKSSVESVESLIERRFKLRSALMKANNEVIVVVSRVSYTIYQAIEKKDIMQFKLKELNQLRSKLREANISYQSQIDKNNNDLNTQIQYFTQNSKEELKASIVKDLTEQMEKMNKVELIDPLNLSNKILELEKEIENFETDIDAALSEINAISLVDVED